MSFLPLLSESLNLARLAFLTDILGHLNELNLTLQGKDRTILELFTKVTCFRSRLDLYIDDIQKGKLLYFVHLKEYVQKVSSSVAFSEFVSFLSQLKENFESRFRDFDKFKDVFGFLHDPFCYPKDGDWLQRALKFPRQSSTEAEYQLAAIDLQANVTLKQQFKTYLC